VLYTGSCCTKHFNNYGILMFGRVLGGIATSLLWSAFESWVVAEHMAAGFDPAWLGEVFSKATFLGNGVVAVLSGERTHGTCPLICSTCATVLCEPGFQLAPVWARPAATCAGGVCSPGRSLQGCWQTFWLRT
jgi:hypothetical protein